MTDLIARLRGCKTSWTMLTALINEAADRIEALQSEVEMWKATANAVVDFEKVELRAEVERLKEEEIQSQLHLERATRANEFLQAERDTLQSRLTALEGQVSQANGMAAAWKLTHDAVLASSVAQQAEPKEPACPVCQARPEFSLDSRVGEWSGRCKHCGVEGSPAPTEAEAIRKWIAWHHKRPAQAAPKHIENVDSVCTSQERVQKTGESKQVPLTDEQCDKVLQRIDEWATGYGAQEYGLPLFWMPNRARDVLREALGEKA